MLSANVLIVNYREEMNIDMDNILKMSCLRFDLIKDFA